MSGSRNNAVTERRKYVSAFNSTMVKIWREQIALLGVYDTGALYRSVSDAAMKADSEFLDVRLEQRFLLYGLFVDFGTGRNTPRGNGGDIGRDNRRRRRRWFSRKHFASRMNLQEFYADSVGREFCAVMVDIFENRAAQASRRVV